MTDRWPSSKGESPLPIFFGFFGLSPPHGLSDLAHFVSDVGDRFYIIESGAALVTKTDDAGKEVFLTELKKGAYFGGERLPSLFPSVDAPLAHDVLVCSKQSLPC